MEEKFAWGILSTGGIARALARAVNRSRLGRLAAIGSRDQESATAFADQYAIPRAYASYADAIDDPEVQGVYVAPPHPFHREWALRAIAAGKHVLCEKPMTMDYAGTAELVQAAQERGVLLVEAYAYRCHPRTWRIAEIVRAGALGEVRLVQANHGISVPFDPARRHFNPALGGGGILDVGSYCTSFALLVADAVQGREGVEPVTVTGAGRLRETRVDEDATATLVFADGLTAQIACGLRLAMENVAWIYGTEARLMVPEPWSPGRESRLYLWRNGSKEPEEIVVTAESDLYVNEADFFAERAAHRAVDWPAMTLEASLANARTLDRWREAIALDYETA